MLLEAPEGARHAAKYLGAAERAAPHATRREQLNTAMLRAWVDDDMARTLRLCEQISDEFPRDRDIIVYCSCPNEVSSARVALQLQRRGFTRVRPLFGGIDAWREQNYPTERKAAVESDVTIVPKTAA